MLTLEDLGDVYREWTIPTKHNVEDISRMYGNSVVRYEGTKYQCKECHCALWSGTLDSVFLGIVVGGTIMYVLLSEVDNSFPEFGYYNLNGSAILISRNIRSRNWRYAYHSTNATVVMPYLEVGTHLLDQLIVLRSQINSMFSNGLRVESYLRCNDTYTPMAEAIELISSGECTSVVLSRKVAVASSPYKDEIGIFLLGVQVGTYEEGTPIINDQWAHESLKEVM